MAVVKADAYGHGAVELASRAVAAGADWLGVARIDEAIELRLAGLSTPILIFGQTPVSRVDELLDQDFVQAIFTSETAAALANAAVHRGKRLRAHLKIDTGMGRLGIPWVGDDAVGRKVALPEIEALQRLDGLEFEGVFTHFANADSADKSDARRQLERFLALISDLAHNGIEYPMRHVANSAALIDLPESHLDLVRTGIATYGLYPRAEVQRQGVELRPVLAWKTRILQIKKVASGFGVSYGTTYRTSRSTTLATVAVGYADGLDRGLSSAGQMLVGGRRIPIVGRVCMDLTVLDLGPESDAAIGDEVVILGRQGDEELTADAMAASLDTINYEIVTSIARRVPRIYLD